MKTMKYSWLFILLCSASLMSQKVFVASDLGVFSGYSYQYMDTKSALKGSYTLGLGYEQKLSDYFSLETGVQYAAYSTGFIIGQNNPIMNTSNEIDAHGSAFEMRSVIKNYEEKFQTQNLAIPLMIFYKKPFSPTDDVKFCVGGGLKYMKPFSQKTTTNIQKLSISGYYPDKNLLIDDLPEAGFGTLYDFKSEYKKDLLKSIIAFSLETGIEYDIDKVKLYTGIFADYAFSNLKKDNQPSTTSLVQYNPNKISDSAVGAISQQTVENVKFLSFGVVIKIPICDFKKR